MVVSQAIRAIMDRESLKEHDPDGDSAGLKGAVGEGTKPWRPGSLLFLARITGMF
jgi:hypothetical protein